MMNFDEIKARVTIRDILKSAGIEAERNRIACPIHGGSNLTSFSFTDSTFICFSCGAEGGLIALVEYLQRCSRQEALCALRRLPEHVSLPGDPRM